MRGIAGEFELHAADGFLRDASEGAAPSSVDCGDGAFLRIDQENGHAVGGLDTEKDARLIGGGGVTLARFGWNFRKQVEHIRVDLLERGELEATGAESGLKFAAIFKDGFARVPFHEAKVENFFGFQQTQAAGAGAEPVNEPGELTEGFELQDLQALRIAEAPRERNSDAGRGNVLARGGDPAGSEFCGASFLCGHDSDSIIGAPG